MTPDPLTEETKGVAQTTHNHIIQKLRVAEESSPSEEILKEIRSFVEQQLLHANEECKSVLYPLLDKIKLYLLSVYQQSSLQRDKDKANARQQPTAFMSYAWPILQLFPDEHWTQLFIIQFALDCFRLGLNIAIDCLHSRFGPSALTFMYEQIESADIVFPIGTKSFRTKMLNPLYVKSMVRHEFEEIGNRMRSCAQMQQPHGVMPCQLTGRTIEEVFIPPYKTHSAAESFQEISYLTFLKELSFRLVFYFKHGLKDFSAISTTTIKPDDELSQLWQTVESAVALKPFWHPIDLTAVATYVSQQQLQRRQQREQYSLIIQHLVEQSSLHAISKPLLMNIAKNISLTQESAVTSVVAEETILRRWNLPTENSQHFVGREQFIRLLGMHFASWSFDKITLSAIVGLGGIGKTQFALHFADNAKTLNEGADTKYYYRWCLWFHAENETTLLNDYMKLASLLKLVSPDEKVEKIEIKMRFKSFLEGNTHWLAIYDNAGNYADLKEFIPQYGGHIIVTSRRAEWAKIGHAIDMTVFTEFEAIQYLQKLTKINNSQANISFSLLAKELANLPLALAQAGAYIERCGCPPEDYLTIYRAESASLQAEPMLPPGTEEPLSVEEKTNYKTVATTWIISLHAIEENERKARVLPLAKLLLQVMSYLYSDSIPREILEKWLCAVYFPDKPMQAKLHLNRTLARLHEYSMISLSAEHGTITIHPLVQSVMRNALQSAATEASESIKIFSGLVNILAAELEEKSQDITDYFHRSKYIAHAQAFIEYTATYFATDENYSLILQRLGNFYFIADEYKKCVQVLEKCLELKVFSTNLARAKIYRVLGRAYGYLEQHAKQLDLLLKAKEFFIEEYKTQQYPEIAETLCYISAAHGAMANYEEQHSILKQALAIQEHFFPREHIEIAKVKMRLGNSYAQLNNPRQQRELLEEVLPIFKQYYGENHMMVAEVLNCLGYAYGSMNAIESNPEYLTKKKMVVTESLEILKKIYGGKSLPVARVIINLADTHGDLKDYPPMRALCDEALTIMRTKNGEENSEYAASLLISAKCYGYLNDNKTKREQINASLSILEKIRGSDQTFIHALYLLDQIDGSDNISLMLEKFRRLYQFRVNKFGVEHEATKRAGRKIEELETKMATAQVETTSKLSS